MKNMTGMGFVGSVVFSLVCGCASVTPPLNNKAEASPNSVLISTNAPLQMSVELVDGSRIIGTPHIKGVTLQTGYAKVDLPLKEIRTIRMNPDHETAIIELQKGDKLTGVLTLAPIRLATVFGKATIGVEHVARISIRSGVSAAALVLYYSFDRNEGDIVTDLSGNGNDGKVNQARWVAQGKVGGAYDFSGNDSAWVSFDPKFLEGSRAMSVSAWFKSYGDPGDWEQIIGCSTEEDNVQTPVSFLWFNRTGLGNNAHTRLLLTQDTGRRESVAIIPSKPTPFFRDGTWHHVVLTWDGTSATYYIDGVPDAKKATGAGTLAYASDRRSLIGNGWAFGRASHNFNGLIDEVMIFNRALQESEVREIHDLQK
jgi:hypothetical protein